MKPKSSLAKWLEENANAPPPPTVPTSLPDDTASTVYPESSVSNPFASRYTGQRHRFSSSRATYPPASYLDRRPSSAQALYRDRDQQQPSAPIPIPVSAPAVRSRFHSVSADPPSRYVVAAAAAAGAASAPQPQPFLYAYTQPKSNNNNNTAYYTSTSAHYTRAHSPTRGAYVPAQPTSTPYRVVSPSPHRVESSRSHETVTARPQYTTYAAYHSTPTLLASQHSRSSTPKKPPLLRRIFGDYWGSSSAPAKVTSQQQLPQLQSQQPPRSSSRSSSKTKTVSQSRSSDRVLDINTTSYKPTSRNRMHSPDNIVYVRG
ncbi:hypothetical protein Clacol_009442 [Clathrus columnatus]|uniref:Uncharacterized protein n=1 Tax=Clathrus columnatus TaxID=1419009 RepID=A0AAV5AKH9_9AGAM|nr:hypothetical protein Clacol_009442 [Clathrus columnatus]